MYGQSLKRNLDGLRAVPQFLDSHPFNPLSERQLKEAQSAPRDGFGVVHDNIIYNEKEHKLFCLLNARSKEAVEKHHKKPGIKCDWIHEVKTTK